MLRYLLLCSALSMVGLLACGGDLAAGQDGPPPPDESRAGEEEQFTRLFNGENLDGWVIVNVAPDTFTVRDGMIVSTGVPTSRPARSSASSVSARTSSAWGCDTDASANAGSRSRDSRTAAMPSRSRSDGASRSTWMRVPNAV